MSSDSKIVLLALATIGALVTALLAWTLKWAYWPTPLSVPVLLAVLLSTNQRRALATEGVEPVPEHYVPQQQAQRENSVTNVTLPSAAPDYDFLFSATIRWRPVPNPAIVLPNANPAALAIDAVLARARAVSQTELPGSFAFTQHKLSGLLGTIVRDTTGQVEAWATNVSLTLADDDLDRLRKIADLHKDEQLWEHQREYERSKRAYLGEDALKTPGSAVVWWLAKKDDAIERTVELIGPLAQLASAANDSEVPELFRHLVPSLTGPAEGSEPDEPGFGPSPNGSRPGASHAFEPSPLPRLSMLDHLGAFMEKAGFTPDTPQSSRAAELFAKVLDSAGRHDAALRIRQAFDVLSTDDTEEPVNAEDREPPRYAVATALEPDWDEPA